MFCYATLFVVVVVVVVFVFIVIVQRFELESIAAIIIRQRAKTHIGRPPNDAQSVTNNDKAL